MIPWTKTIFIFGYIFLCSPTFAGTYSEGAEIANALSMKYTECFSYYTIAAVCASKSETSQAKTVVSGAFEGQQRSMKYSYIMGKAANLSEAAMEARLRLVSEDMKKQIDNGCQNISVIIEKYGSNCKIMLDDPNRAFLEESEKSH